jgi:hypothetical protein
MTRARYEEELKAGIDTEAYYFIYDETNEKFSYVTLQYLEDSYSTTSQM